jgi:cysteinyl-tRNA synthetase
MIGELFEGVRIVNSVNDGKLPLTAEGIQRLTTLMRSMVHEVLGLRNEQRTGGDDKVLEGLVAEFIRLRAEAKARKDYAGSDAIRDRLLELGIALKDTKEGTTWSRA